LRRQAADLFAPAVTSRRDRLNTFVAPRPTKALIRALTPVNRIFCLGGVPGLRAVPGLRRIPGIRGVCDVIDIDLPRADQDRLLMAVNPRTAAFLVPNHPEFFTDWMLDKELSARVAPMMASWATHEVVNGMGALTQCFWLKNNLIAQIPGEGGEAGRAYSVEWALQGNGVLLHPEGSVGWHGDHIATLFPGVVEMALRALTVAEERGLHQRVFIAPVVWKLRFTRDVTRALEREMRYVERRLGIEPARGDLAARVYHAYRRVLAREATRLRIASDPAQPYFRAQAQLLADMAERLRSVMRPYSDELPARIEPGSADLQALLRPVERWLRGSEAEASVTQEVRALLQAARRCLRLMPAMYPAAEWTQEHVAENIKRLRSDYCLKGLRDNLHRFVPIPAGPRVAHIRAAQPLDMKVVAGGLDPSDAAARARLVTTLREAMQSTLDALLRETHPLQQGPRLRNPFLR
jgi:hypothetical protein